MPLTTCVVNMSCAACCRHLAMERGRKAPTAQCKTLQSPAERLATCSRSRSQAVPTCKTTHALRISANAAVTIDTTAFRKLTCCNKLTFAPVKRPSLQRWRTIAGSRLSRAGISTESGAEKQAAISCQKQGSQTNSRAPRTQVSRLLKGRSWLQAQILAATGNSKGY